MENFGDSSQIYREGADHTIPATCENMNLGN